MFLQLSRKKLLTWVDKGIMIRLDYLSNYNIGHILQRLIHDSNWFISRTGKIIIGLKYFLH